MKKMTRLLLSMLLICSYSAKSYSQTFDAWRTTYGLTESERNSDKDGDGYSNFTEYALGMNPLVVDTVGRDIFVSSKIDVNKEATTDVFWQVWRANDYTPTNIYTDWEIANSKEGTAEWIGDYVVADVVNGSDKQISITIPSAYTNYAHRLVAMDTEIFPVFDPEHVNIQPMVRSPMGDPGVLTAEDHQFFADHPYIGGSLQAEDIAAIKALEPNVIAQDYVNAGIEIGETYPLDDLSVEDYVLWDEINNEWALYSANNPRYIIDWRKPGGVSVRKQAIIDRLEIGTNAQFVDAWVKVGASSGRIIDEDDKQDYFDAFFDFLTWLKETQTSIRVLNIDATYLHPLMYNDFTTQYFTTPEGALNAYFNAFYDESYDKEAPDDLAERIDWTINKWTRHGKIYLNRGHGLDLEDEYSVFLMSYYLIVMGKHSYYMGTAGVNNYNSGGWKSPEMIEHVTWRPMGEAKSLAVRNGYVYTREFEHAKVVLNAESKTCLIKWYNTDGSLDTTWGTHPDLFPDPVSGVNVSPDSIVVLIGTTKEISATVTPSLAINKNLTWSSSDTTIAKVNSSGVVTAIAIGSTFITVTTEEGGFQDSCMVNIGDVYVSNIDVIQESDSLNTGEYLTLNTTISPSNATIKSVIWSTSDDEVATVSQTGLVTATGTGTATITATTDDGGFTDSCIITSWAEALPTPGITGYYHISNRGLAVFAGDDSRAAGDALTLVDLVQGEASMIWVESLRPDGFYTYQLKNTNYCIDGGDGGANSQVVTISAFDSEDKNQHWSKEMISEGVYRLIKRDVEFGMISGDIVNLWRSPSPSVSMHWTFTEVSQSTGINNVAAQGVNVHPNPASGVLNIEINSTETATMSIINNTGQVVLTSDIQGGSATIDISGYSSGFYIVSISSGSENYLRKVIVK